MTPWPTPRCCSRAYETTYELTDIGLGHSELLWSVLHLVESAKALVDAVAANPQRAAHA